MLVPLPMVHSRKCGECTVCCTVTGVQELGKPYYVSCEHVTKGGCGIYPDRPGTCKTYKCVWLQGNPLMADDQRPDKCGYLVNMEQDSLGIWVEFFLTRDVDDIDAAKMLTLAGQLFSMSADPLRGVRFVRSNQLVATAYPLDSSVYPDEGEGEQGRTWGTHDNVLFFLAEDKQRKKTTANESTD